MDFVARIIAGWFLIALAAGWYWVRLRGHG